MKRLTLLILLFAVSYCKAAVTEEVLNKSVVLHIKLLEDDLKYHKAICSGTYVSPYSILTAAHCVDSTEFYVWAQDVHGKTFECKLVKIAAQKDLALLRIVSKNYKGHSYVHKGKAPVVGQPVIVVGSPYGLNFMVSNGIVSKIGLKVADYTAIYVLHTAMINPGSSGGGLFDLAGNLIGVNTMSIGSPFGWAGISAAVDLNTIKGFLK